MNAPPAVEDLVEAFDDTAPTLRIRAATMQGIADYAEDMYARVKERTSSAKMRATKESK